MTRASIALSPTPKPFILKALSAQDGFNEELRAYGFRVSGARQHAWCELTFGFPLSEEGALILGMWTCDYRSTKTDGLQKFHQRYQHLTVEYEVKVANTSAVGPSKKPARLDEWLVPHNEFALSLNGIYHYGHFAKKIWASSRAFEFACCYIH